MPDLLVPQWDDAPAFFSAFAWTILHAGDLEADDLLGSLAHAESAAGGSTLLFTGDRDMFQCVTDRVHVLFPGKGGPDELGPDEVRARYGVEPGAGARPDRAARRPVGRASRCEGHRREGSRRAAAALRDARGCACGGGGPEDRHDAAHARGADRAIRTCCARSSTSRRCGRSRWSCRRTHRWIGKPPRRRRASAGWADWRRGFRLADTQLMRDLLQAAADHAANHLEDLDERAVAPAATYADMMEAFAGPLPENGTAPRDVLDALARDAAPGLTAMNHPRYFGFVIGGTLPAALTADWMVSTWDQNAGLALPTPAVAAIEEVAGGLGAGRPRPARRCLVRVRDRLPDGTRDLPRRRPQPCSARRGMGCRARRVDRRAADQAARRRRTSRDRRQGSAPARHGNGVHRDGGRRRVRGDGRGRPGRGASGHPRAPRSSARRRETSTRVPSTRSTASPTSRQRRARGCTSTARSASGARRARRSVRPSPASTGPTPGRPMATNG